MNTYLSQEKLPQALAEREALRNELERVANEPAMTNADLDTLHQQVRWLALGWIRRKRKCAPRTYGHCLPLPDPHDGLLLLSTFFPRTCFPHRQCRLASLARH